MCAMARSSGTSFGMSVSMVSVISRAGMAWIELSYCIAKLARDIHNHSSKHISTFPYTESLWNEGTGTAQANCIYRTLAGSRMIDQLLVDLDGVASPCQVQVARPFHIAHEAIHVLQSSYKDVHTSTVKVHPGS